MQEISVEAIVENLDKVTEFIDSQLEAAGCSMKSQTKIDIAIDELFGNIAHYAYTPNIGKVIVKIEIIKNPLSAEITFVDNGRKFNPLDKKDPDVEKSAKERTIGGLGIFMVKNIMDEIVYEYKEGCNIVKIKKSL